MKDKFVRLLGAAVVSSACLIATASADIQPMELHIVSWEAPAANEDGSPLTNLAGYYVYMGSSPEMLVPYYFVTSLQQRMELWYPHGTTRFFAVTAINVDGVQSQMGPIVGQ